MAIKGSILSGNRIGPSKLSGLTFNTSSNSVLGTTSPSMSTALVRSYSCLATRRPTILALS